MNLDGGGRTTSTSTGIHSIREGGGGMSSVSCGNGKLRQWLIEQIDSNKYPGLVWENEEKSIFRIPWKHAGKQDYNREEDAALFKVLSGPKVGMESGLGHQPTLKGALVPEVLSVRAVEAPLPSYGYEIHAYVKQSLTLESCIPPAGLLDSSVV